MGAQRRPGFIGDARLRRPVKVRVERMPKSQGPTQELDLPGDATAETVVRALSLHPDAVLVVRDNAPIPLDGPLGDGDTVTVINIVSGG